MAATVQPLQFIAPNSFSLWSSYDLTDRWTVGAGANYMDQRYERCQHRQHR
jgi:outer membrane receptor for monomeric catechols